jgi:hypothetical protein
MLILQRTTDVFDLHKCIHSIIQLDFADTQLETLLRRITLLIPSPILPHGLLRSTLVLFKVLDLLRIHVLHDRVGLPFFEAKPDPLVAIILVICPVIVSNLDNSVFAVQLAGPYGT